MVSAAVYVNVKTDTLILVGFNLVGLGLAFPQF